ncbi:MAG: deoxyribodipyrimidine photo-lyase [Salibacteraceae bacterium]
MNMDDKGICIFWHRRDLRIDDNHGLYRALENHSRVQPIFIFDSNILNRLEDKDDRRVTFILDSITQLDEALREAGSSLWVFHGKPTEVFESLTNKHRVQAVYCNHDYEPYATERDGVVEACLKAKDVSFKTFKDQVVFEKDEILKDNGDPYIVYTPYSRAWHSKLEQSHLRSYNVSQHLNKLNRTDNQPIPTLEQLGFIPARAEWPPSVLDTEIVKNYHKTRDIPGINGTSRMSVHLRFGTVSIRQLTKQAVDLNRKYLNELIWREFYQMILWHYPRVVNESFRKEYDRIKWRNNEDEFQAWCCGKTGFPMVDAGMRELNATGYMHNRARMITASFLTKDLLIDWRWGEAYFARKLLDYDLASNNGGWQWAAGTGVDAAPYFRIFNPELQAKKFDPEAAYIKKWIPEYGTDAYTAPIVDHQMARKRALEAYAKAVR